MMNSNTSSEHYNKFSMGLHWLMLALMVLVFALIELRELFPKGSDPREALKSLHFMVGLLILFLATARLMFRFVTTAPAIHPAPSRLKKTLALVVHVLLYVLMIGVPVAGWLYLSAAGKPIPFFGYEMNALIGQNKDLAASLKELHKTAGSAGYFLIGLHAAAALVHHYVLKDNTLLRMLPPRSTNNEEGIALCRAGITQ